MSFEINLSAFRHASWGGTSGLADLIRLNDDWSGAEFTWAFSEAPGGPNAITLTNAPLGTQGVNATFDAGYLHPSTGDATGGTTIRPQINQATFEALADPGSGAAPLTLHHTLYVTPEGESRRVLCFGNFTIRKGAPTS